MAEVRAPRAISRIWIKGFKSFFEEQRIEIRPLTLLAGANSSGKSSALQPILLLKQTLDEPADRGPLVLDGPHVRFTSAKQVLSRLPGGGSVDEFSITVGPGFREVFRRTADDGFEIIKMIHPLPRMKSLVLEPGLSSQELENRFPALRRISERQPAAWRVVRNRCFLAVASEESSYSVLPPLFRLADPLRSIIHVPSLRGNLRRDFPTAVIEEYFRGEFTDFAASILASWQQVSDPRLEQLMESLGVLGLTSTIRVRAVDATRIELLVGRTPRDRNLNDLVNIADVGFGVSQVLPVLVALLVAKPGQLVYLEEPELHLHPRAQQALADILAEAAKRRVHVVAETHSSILLRGVQANVAEGTLPPSDVSLHWFKRNPCGATKVTRAKLDQLGAYGDWPEDFGEVEADVDNRYLDAVESRISSRAKK